MIYMQRVCDGMVYRGAGAGGRETESYDRTGTRICTLQQAVPPAKRQILPAGR